MSEVRLYPRQKLRRFRASLYLGSSGIVLAFAIFATGHSLFSFWGAGWLFYLAVSLLCAFRLAAAVTCPVCGAPISNTDARVPMHLPPELAYSSNIFFYCAACDIVWDTGIYDGGEDIK
jgi:hypothetical protein